jgi:hypothetical protein
LKPKVIDCFRKWRNERFILSPLCIDCEPSAAPTSPMLADLQRERMCLSGQAARLARFQKLLQTTPAPEPKPQPMAMCPGCERMLKLRMFGTRRYEGRSRLCVLCEPK